VADLDDDGSPEVIFASWTRKGSHQTGKLHILDALGNPLQTVNLPPAFGSPDWNGSLAAPTLANIDADADLEAVLLTAHSGLVAYDLPGSSQANVIWGTGRGGTLRDGRLQRGSLLASSMTVDPIFPDPGSVLTYTIKLVDAGPELPDVVLTGAIPAGVTYLGDLWASSGVANYGSGVISWSGEVSSQAPVTIRYSAQVDGGLSDPTVIANTVTIADGQGNVFERGAVVIVDAVGSWLPLVRR
jgi:uncharacterized repeat protein (TIGR01451 family)